LKKDLTYKNLNMQPNKTREELIPQLLNKNNAMVGVELGVFRGEFSKVLLDNWSGCLYMIDPWQPLGDEYNDACDDAQLYNLYAAATKNIKGHESRGFMLRGLGKELLDLFADESLDFIYIDANHAYDHVKQDLAMWYPKLKPGGLFAGHDYLSVDWCDNSNELTQLCENNKDRNIYSFNNKGKYFAGEFGVNPAVDEFCKLHNKDFLVTEEFWGTWYFIK
jgi:hypothetical protein